MTRKTRNRVIHSRLAPWFFVILAMTGFAAFGLSAPSAHAAEGVKIASGPTPSSDATKDAAKDDDDDKQTPEERMLRRHPQPVRIGHLVGLPVLDGGDSTIGYVREVVRGPDGKVSLIVPYSAWFGWARTERGKRLVAVPIETVAILARQINALEMERDDFDEAPTWSPNQGTTLKPDDMTKIALGRR